MHIVTLAAVILSTYGTAIQNPSLCQHHRLLWIPGQGGHPSEAEDWHIFFLCFPLVGCRNFEFLPHATRLQKCVLRLLAGDSAVFLTTLCEAEETSVVKSTKAQVAVHKKYPVAS